MHEKKIKNRNNKAKYQTEKNFCGMLFKVIEYRDSLPLSAESNILAC